MREFSASHIRNFSIIAHIDHGKSTLADRLLERTETIRQEKMHDQYLDSMDLERERGITIKMQPVRMEYEFGGERYLLNMIDTPGHVDFAYEVSRSLAAVEGVILLVDASKGIQAQTIGNLDIVRSHGLEVIPVVNKVDLPQARVEETKEEIAKLVGANPSSVISISAKKGTNVDTILEALIKRVPPPEVAPSRGITRALIFDSEFDSYKGVLAFVRLVEGKIRSGDTVRLLQAGAKGQVKEVGVFSPELVPVPSLGAGEIGYVGTGIKEADSVRVGDTVAIGEADPLPGYREPRPMVFLGLYPEKPEDFDELKAGLERLKLTDAALSYAPERKEGLGRGFQCGFLGLLHAEIITERLTREFGVRLALSQPSVLFKAELSSGKEVLVRSPSEWPEEGTITKTFEMWARVQILVPQSYMGGVLELLGNVRSEQKSVDYLGPEKVELVYELPLRELFTRNFYDRLKSASQGFASLNYELLDFRESKLVKMDILVLGRKEETLSKIVPEDEAYREGKAMVEKLKEHLPPQLFAVPLQAALGSKIIARETIAARRRDVTASLYGGDFSRKKKLLEKQKAGKKELQARGQVSIPHEVLLKLFRL